MSAVYATMTSDPQWMQHTDYFYKKYMRQDEKDYDESYKIEASKCGNTFNTETFEHASVLFSARDMWIPHIQNEHLLMKFYFAFKKIDKCDSVTTKHVQNGIVKAMFKEIELRLHEKTFYLNTQYTNDDYYFKWFKHNHQLLKLTFE